MSMKVEIGLMDGRNIENWLQSTEKGLQEHSEASRQAQ
jgi:hypothetical protein